jgi:signal transduction histidine kinase/CheY-like chemotaxis protein
LNSNSFNTKKEKQKYIVSIINNGNKQSNLIKTNEFEFFPENSGDYQLEFQAIDRDMNYSKARVLDLSIVGPWYWRLNYLLPILGFFSFIFYVVYTTTSRYVKQKEFNEKLRLQAQKKDQEARRVVEQKNKDLQESQKAAEAANEAKSTFLANMSHELRTPLNAIIGYSEMLIEDAEDENEDFIPDLDKINSSGKHLLGLINDILDLSKVESGKMELFIEEFDLEKILKEVEATITPLVEKNNNSLNLTINTETKSILADITKIRQILLNLLSNATKFTEEGEINIIVDDNPNKSSLIDFKVSDSGIGMTPEQVDKVFKPFTQADEKTTRKFGGTGLGLTITKMFAEMMGGGIDLSSKINEGTTFIVSIPKVVIDPKKIKDQIEDIEVKTENNSFTILVIDDDANAQELMKKFLIKESYNVLQATSGPSGLDLAAKHLPDLITLDVMMPEMDGWEVLAALQSNEITKNIPVIMLTMANEPDIGYSLGATDYLTKPVDWGRLSSILQKHEIETSSQSILIVEDDEITRDMLKKSLETNEFKVTVAKNGKDGLEKVKKAKPALILLDLMMPEMDGFEFSEQLRENKEWLDIPVVVITAKDLTSEDHNRLKGNVEAIMQKGSYSRDELLSEVGQRIKKLKEEV